MRTIEKGPEPLSLRRHRKSGGTYEDYTQTDDLRKALLKEQGHICCYCMSRITLRGMKIEHWAPQTAQRDATVDYKNLMGACSGGNGERDAIKHCDTARQDTPLKVNPLDHTQRCERLIRYLANGEMCSIDSEINQDINATLNLNNDRLKPKRGQVLDILKHRLEAEQKGYWPSDLLERELKAWERLDKAGMYREYCQVAIYFLEKKLKRKA